MTIDRDPSVPTEVFDAFTGLVKTFDRAEIDGVVTVIVKLGDGGTVTMTGRSALNRKNEP